MTKLYLSGKISDPDPEKKKAYLQLFHDEEKRLSKQEYYDIINPASLEGECCSYEDYLARDILIITEQHPEIWLLPNWKDSPGARIEVALAKRLGLKIHNE